jgi:hypothetical protein
MHIKKGTAMESPENSQKMKWNTCGFLENLGPFLVQLNLKVQEQIENIPVPKDSPHYSHYRRQHVAAEGHHMTHQYINIWDSRTVGDTLLSHIIVIDHHIVNNHRLDTIWI